MNEILDIKNRKIMFELDKNSRQNIIQLSKKAKIPRSIVEYRIKKLLNEGIITKFVTEVALGKLGYFTYKLYCQISGLSKKEEEDLFSDLMKNDDFIWIAKCEGRWDLLLASYVRNVTEFAKIKKNFLLKYGKFISDYAVTIIDEAYILERTHLLPNKRRESIELYIGGPEKADLTDKEKKLLKIMANNANIRVLDLSKMLELNIRTVISMIKRLEQEGVIQGYTAFFNLNKIGYQFFKLCIYLKEPNQKRYDDLLRFCKNHENIIHLIESIGPWELELEIEVPSNREFQNLSNDIRNIFSDIVKKVESVIISHEMKLEFLPKEI